VCRYADLHSGKGWCRFGLKPPMIGDSYIPGLGQFKQFLA